MCEKCPSKELFLVRIFLYWDWIRILRSKYPYSARIQENMDHGVNLRIQPEYRKIRTRNNSTDIVDARPEITPYLETFHAVTFSPLICFWLLYPFYSIWKHQNQISDLFSQTYRWKLLGIHQMFAACGRYWCSNLESWLQKKRLFCSKI